MEKRARAKLNAHYALICGLFWSGNAVLWAFLSVVLLAFGFNNMQVGIVSAGALLLSMLLQPSLSARCDRSEELTTRRVLLVLGGLSLVICLLLDLSAGTSKLVMAALFVALGAVLTMTPPFHNSLAVELIAAGADLNFGLGRGIGSVGYAIAITLAGGAVSALGARVTMHLFLLLTTLSVVTIFLFRPQSLSVSKTRRPEKAMGLLPFLKQYPLYTQTLIACSLLIGAHTATTTYMFQIVGRVGAQSDAMGLALGIGALVELPAMMCFSRVKKKIGLGRIFCFSACMVIVRVVGLLFARSILMVYLTMALQGVEYGFYALSSVFYAAHAIPSEHRVRAQALIHIFPSGLGSAVGNFFCGWLLDRFGVSGMLLFPLVCAVSGAVILYSAMKRERNLSHA